MFFDGIKTTLVFNFKDRARFPLRDAISCVNESGRKLRSVNGNGPLLYRRDIYGAALGRCFETLLGYLCSSDC